MDGVLLAEFLPSSAEKMVIQTLAFYRKAIPPKRNRCAFVFSKHQNGDTKLVVIFFTNLQETGGKPVLLNNILDEQ